MLSALISLALASMPPRAIRLSAPATAVALAADGGFAVGFESGDVTLYRRDFQVATTFRERGPIRALAFSPDGQVLATGFRDDGRNVTTALWNRKGGLIRYFNAVEGKPVLEGTLNRGFALHSTSRLAWSPNGKLIAAEHDGHMDTGVRIWDTSGKLTAELGRYPNWKAVPESERLSMAAGVKGLKFSPDGNTIVTSMDDGFVRAWLPNGRVKWQTQITKENGVADADFTLDGTQVVFASSAEDRKVGALDSRTGKIEWTSRAPSYPSAVSGFSPELMLIATRNTLLLGARDHFELQTSVSGTITQVSVAADRSELMVTTTEPLAFLIKKIR